MTEKIAQLLLTARAVQLCPDKPFTFASGIRSPVYCDNRVLLSRPVDRELVIDALKALLPNGFDCLAGTATAGIPWAAWLAQRTGKPMVYVRGKAKVHGKQNLVEGNLTTGQRVVVVEDLVSTGGSALAAVEALREAGADVRSCVAIFTYGMEKATKAFAAEDCDLKTATDLTMLLKVALHTNVLTSELAQRIRDWSRNPEAWQP